MDNNKRQTVDWRNRLEYGYSYTTVAVIIIIIIINILMQRSRKSEKRLGKSLPGTFNRRD